MKIQETLRTTLRCDHLELLDESHLHGKVDTHYKLTVVSEEFAGVALLARHRKVLSQLEGWNPHALSLHLYTPSEWEKRSGPPQSPRCSNKR